ncbi:CDP-diacylglycerol--serine O-phosphatidyltransferase [Taibaiella soli]|uniref:CDP-diacylglycerol--serine O-phosphatidyltransferase n=2 Tax=Taibaiella soli TaxID=1649169 RepID=A0A2W2AIR8_9BACT|nr:CDP-diacylglycerol--serine O-phosphatidyltransferase [Taibaiella soli]
MSFTLFYYIWCLMKHLPNLLTLANLFCGCSAIAFILNAQPFYIAQGGISLPVWGVEQLYWGSLLIGIAAICDILDGFVARSLQLFSPIGKDLDSLADLVSFGVAPAMILFKLLWAAEMKEPGALNASMLTTAPAFLLACFGALRLARFNVSAPQKGGFTGMPIPAAGIFVASFPLLLWYNPYGIGEFLYNKWVIYLIIALLSWLMVSKIRFIKLMPAKWDMAHTWPQLILIVATVALFFAVKSAAIPFAFILYILLSLFYKQPVEKTTAEASL